MNVLVTGQYEQDYNRTMVLLAGLKKLGINLVELPYEKRDLKTRKVLSEAAKTCDLAFLPSFTHLDVPFVRKTISIPVVFDPLISRYLTKVFDRKTVWRYSPRAYKNYLKDKNAFSHSDLILADTASHKEYYCHQFKVDPAKIVVIPVGVNTDEFHPLRIDKTDNEKIIIGFYGSFIPLHGIDKILLAANELRDQENIHFLIYGSGVLYDQMLSMHKKLQLSNVELKGYIHYHDLNRAINQMDICLGVFGESLKTELVIPNKVYHYAACAKPIVTRDTKGIREIFRPDDNIILSENDPTQIAGKILFLAQNENVREQIGTSAYTLIRKNYNETEIAGSLVNAFNGIIHSTSKN